jgi:hypothetical protein
MAYTLGSVASLCIVGPNIKVLEVIEKRISEEDLRTMQKYGLENKDGKMDRAEYLILCMLRLGVVDPELVMAIVNRYNELDTSGDGVLSYGELLEESPRPSQRGLVVTTRRRSSSRGGERGGGTGNNSRKFFKQNSLSSDADDPMGGRERRDGESTLFVAEDRSQRSSPSLIRESPFSGNDGGADSPDTQSQGDRVPNQKRSREETEEVPPHLSRSLEKGQRLSARVSELKEQRARERSLYGGGGMGLSLNSPVRPVPLSPLITRHLPSKNSRHGAGMRLGESLASFSQPRLPRPHSSSSPTLPSQRPRQTQSLHQSLSRQPAAVAVAAGPERPASSSRYPSTPSSLPAPRPKR